MVGFNTNGVGYLLVSLDRQSRTPAHVQLEISIRDAIRGGRLTGGSAVPSSRRLADQLGLSRGVVVEAYQQLVAEGYLTSHTGGYTQVADGLAHAMPYAHEDAAALGGTAGVDFRYGRPDVSQFPRAAWLRSLRTVLTETPHERLNYLDGRGAPELRAALADYLNRVRGTWASPQNVIVCNGFAQAVSLMMPVLHRQGFRRLAVEVPSDSDAVGVARGAGLEVVGIPVGDGGLDVDALETSGADAVLVTSAHQFPTGCVLSPQGRSALVTWAKSGNRVIIEDDYDAEYRYDQTPVGAVHGLAPDQVIYAGTTSKTLAPGLRLGWMVAPNRFVTALAAQKVEYDRGSPVIDQLAFAEFIRTGDFDRHLRRMRPIYRRRRDRILTQISQLLPELTPVGVAAGLHVFCWLPEELPEQPVLETARRHGLIIDGVAGYQLDDASRGGLIFGYGKLQDAAIDRGIGLLRRTFDDVRGRTDTAP
jgi:GntR family transcriptional regulator / MocR family aminotransferase